MRRELPDRCRAAAEDILRDSIEVKKMLLQQGMAPVADMVDRVVQTFREGGRFYIFGNGGSAADAQHLAAELVNRFQRERRPLPAVALTVDSSILTAVGNDYSFEDIFVKQLQALAQPGDVALGISTSGCSANVVKALKWARGHGVHTMGWAGADRTEMNACCDLVLNVPSRVTARIQECHITVGHILCGLVEEMLFGEGESSGS